MTSNSAFLKAVQMLLCFWKEASIVFDAAVFVMGLNKCGDVVVGERESSVLVVLVLVVVADGGDGGDGDVLLLLLLL